MRRSMLLLFATFISIIAIAQNRAMTTDDGLDMINLSSAYMSPDGNFAIYGKSELDWKENKRKTTYHYINYQGNLTYQYIGKEGASDIKFSPKGEFLSFKRTVDKKQQIFYMRTAGGEAIKLTDHKSSIGGYQWSPDGSRIFFISSTPLSKEDEKEHKKGTDHVIIDEGPNGQNEGKWNNLFVFDIEAKNITRLTKAEQRIGSFDISPEGNRILYTSRTENRRNQGNLSEIFMMSLQDSSVVQLTDNKAPESRPLWAPDGLSFAYSAADDKVWDLKNGKIWVMDVDTKNHKVVSEKFIGSIRSRYFWTPDGKAIIFSGLKGVYTSIYNLDVATGNITNLTNQNKGTYSLIDLNKERTKMIYSYTDHQTPRDLYASSIASFQPNKLTDLNPGHKEKFNLANAEPIKWQSKDGLEIEGMLYLPKDYSKKEQSQFLLHIHGGPAGVFTDSYSYRYHVWAGLGYVQLAPNVRGSSGYSDELLRGNMNDIGGQDYEDLMTGVDKLIKDKVIDEDKMAVRGWSYGGILGGITITKTNRFKSASLGAMVADWTSEYGIGFNYDVRLWYIGGTPWENPEAYRAKSALTNAANVTTPTLLLHGGMDRTDTEVQSMMFFTALKDMGKTVRYIRFPREPHGFREPRHQRTRDIEEIKWIQKYTLGDDWEPWKRKVEDDKEGEDKSK
jgi:dipeptidyl aminopeptidase/acylaminoacyl peptidase